MFVFYKLLKVDCIFLLDQVRICIQKLLHRTVRENNIDFPVFIPNLHARFDGCRKFIK